MSTSSTNMTSSVGPGRQTRVGVRGTPAGLLDRDDRDLAAVLAVILEADLAVDLRVQRVILAQAHIEARLEAAPLLPHEDRTAGHEVAVVPLHTQALRVAVAPVAGTALPLFMSHC